MIKVYWMEPRAGGSESSRSIPRNENLNYRGYRRLLIIATDEGHSTCLSILTYEGRACTKKGVESHKHGIIHDSRKRPSLVHREPSLGFLPIAATMMEGETLALESRINYSKTVTIEHNTPVKFLGDIVPPVLAMAQNAANTCLQSSLQTASQHGDRSRGKRRALK